VSPESARRQPGSPLVLIDGSGYTRRELTYSPAGAYPSGKLGEEPRGKPGNLLPLLAQIAIGREKSNLKIFGNDYPTP
jgi:UDP-glucose 4-epimerase